MTLYAVLPRLQHLLAYLIGTGGEPDVGRTEHRG